jgi:N-acetylneuraminic acid mutarotase
MIIFGGIGHTQYDDCWELNTSTLAWRQIAASGDKPEKILGHASAALGSRLFLFGGQVGRTFVKKLYVLDTRQWVWTRLQVNESNLPSARSGHALVASNGDLWLFGGQGMKLMSDFYRLDVSRNEVAFIEINTTNDARPTPRKGHSLTYEPHLNSLVLFGGTTASGADNSLWVYDISSNQVGFNSTQLYSTLLNLYLVGELEGVVGCSGGEELLKLLLGGVLLPAFLVLLGATPL